MPVAEEPREGIEQRPAQREPPVPPRQFAQPRPLSVARRPGHQRALGPPPGEVEPERRGERREQRARRLGVDVLAVRLQRDGRRRGLERGPRLVGLGLHLAHRADVAADGLRQVGVDVAPEQPARHHDHHAPERDRHDPAHLQRGVEQDEERAERAEPDVEREPVPERPEPREPPHPLARDVHRHAEGDHRRPRDAEPVADVARRAEEVVARREGAVGERGEVVVEAGPRERQRDGDPREAEGEVVEAGAGHEAVLHEVGCCGRGIGMRELLQGPCRILPHRILRAPSFVCPP